MFLWLTRANHFRLDERIRGTIRTTYVLLSGRQKQGNLATKLDGQNSSSQWTKRKGILQEHDGAGGILTKNAKATHRRLGTEQLPWEKEQWSQMSFETIVLES